MNTYRNFHQAQLLRQARGQAPLSHGKMVALLDELSPEARAEIERLAAFVEAQVRIQNEAVRPGTNPNFGHGAALELIGALLRKGLL